jgi:N-methylhydantoinase B
LTSERVYRVLYDEAALTVIAERGLVAPDGLFGGHAGGKFFSKVVRADASSKNIPSKGEFEVVRQGDRVHIRPAAGGGYGSPLEREPERVLDDVRDGYVSPDAAAELYGVVVDPDGRKVDVAATAQRRKAMAEQHSI